MDDLPAPDPAARTPHHPVRTSIALAPWRRTVRAMARFATVTEFSAQQLRVLAAVLAMVVFLAWRSGWFWTGMAAAAAVMLIDGTAGALAREQGDPGLWDRRVAAALQWMAPPLWWAAWIEGLSGTERAFEPVYGMMVLTAILFGHVTSLVIERIFGARFGFAFDAWRPFDHRFQRLAAGRDNDLAILFLSLLFARPDRGIELVALWTLCTLVVQATRLAQANDRHVHGRAVVSWRS